MTVSERNQDTDSRLVQNAMRLDDMQCTTTVRILVVDDDAATCQVITAALEHKEFQIVSVSDPAQLEMVLKGNVSFHLVILDYILPGLSADQVLTWLQENQPDASVIVITGYPSMEGALNCLRARTYDYLTKPFQIAHLRQTVQRCLQDKSLLRMTEETLCLALGNAIRERRKAADMTLAQLARRAGVSLGYLSQIELGKSAASIEKLYRVCLGLGVRLPDLFETILR
jgi:DNA-binding NtrC family response regulator